MAAKGGKRLAELQAKLAEVGERANKAAKRGTEVAKAAREVGVTEAIGAAAGGAAAGLAEEYGYLNLQMGDFDMPVAGYALGLTAMVVAPKMGKAGKEIKATGLGSIGYAAGRSSQIAYKQWKKKE